MRRIQNITDEPIQRHTILFEKSEIIFTLRFYPRTQIWMFDAEFGDKQVYGQTSISVCEIGRAHV